MTLPTHALTAHVATRKERPTGILPLLLGAVLFLVTPGAADAQQRQPKEGTPAAGRATAEVDGLGPTQILNMLDAWAIVRAQETLQIPDDRYGEFVSRLKRLQSTRRRNLQARNALLQELRRLTAPRETQADENAIRERLQALRAHDEQAAAEIRKVYDELDQILDPRQQARFRLFEEVLERRKIDLLKRAQQGASRPRRE